MSDISFNSIPLVVNTPGFFAEFDSSRAANALAPIPHVSLIIGQKLSTGTAVAGVPVRCDTKELGLTLFGKKSALAQAVAAYKAVDPLTELWCIPLTDDAGGTEATGSITWSGTASYAGELAIYIGGRRVAVAVTASMTSAQLETAALAAVALQTDLPVSAAGDSGTGLDLTANHKGTIGNGIMLGVALAPGEQTFGFTFTVTAMSGGATDPDHATAVTAMEETQYNTVVSCLNTSTEVAKLVTEMESRFGPMRMIDGQLFIAKPDTNGNLTTAGNAYNSLTLSLVGYEKSGYTELPWEVAARAAAADTVQDKSDPALHRGGILLGGNAPPQGARFTRAVRDVLLTDGVSTLKPSSDGRMVIERLITTYQTNGNSIPDQAYMDIFTVRTLSALRYTLRVLIGTKFARCKLMDDVDDLAKVPDNTVTPTIVKNEILAWYKACLEDRGWVEDFATFAAQLRVTRAAGDPNRLNMFVPVDVMNNFLVGAAKIAFAR